MTPDNLRVNKINNSTIIAAAISADRCFYLLNGTVGRICRLLTIPLILTITAEEFWTVRLGTPFTKLNQSSFGLYICRPARFAIYYFDSIFRPAVGTLPIVDCHLISKNIVYVISSCTMKYMRTYRFTSNFPLQLFQWTVPV